MDAQQIRALAICVFRDADRILVGEAHDPIEGLTFFRPLGGGIEFGETGAQAVARELREEIGAEVSNVRRIGLIENIFTYMGVARHEIVQVYDGEFLDRSLYELRSIPGVEGDGKPFRALWRMLGSFSPEEPLYPAGLKELLLKLEEEPHASAT